MQYTHFSFTADVSHEAYQKVELVRITIWYPAAAACVVIMITLKVIPMNPQMVNSTPVSHTGYRPGLDIYMLAFNWTNFTVLFTNNVVLEDKLKPKYVTTVVICLSLSNTIANWEEGGREGGYDQELCPSGDRVQGQDQPAPGGRRKWKQRMEFGGKWEVEKWRAQVGNWADNFTSSGY